MYSVFISTYFKGQLKELCKKDRALKNVIVEIFEQFRIKNAIPIGKHLYKVRISKMDKGKRGGYRLYIYVLEVEKILTPIVIYAKNKQTLMTKKEVLGHLEQVLLS